VRDVFVAGVQVIDDGRHTLIDTNALWRVAAEHQQSLLQRAGITVPHRWPQIDAR
jgi:hypothetical protein